MCSLPEKFTYPFAYTPHPLIKEAAERLVDRISVSETLDGLFSEGKMMGVMLVRKEGAVSFLYAFSGLAGGLSEVEGFVPPLLDITDKEGYFKKEEERISGINRRISELPDVEASELKALRKRLSEDLQDWISGHYVVHNARGESKTVKEIFELVGKKAPGGTGDCAGPKLLEYAYLNGYEPLAMGEFWYGRSPADKVRVQGNFYSSCIGKCGPLLGFMLQGLDVEDNPLDVFNRESELKTLYSDDAVIVVDKPSGMLAVPGRTKSDCALNILKKRFSTDSIYSCHRLDMDTSGLMVFARSVEYQACIQRQFEDREVRKTYMARLLPSRTRKMRVEGVIDLPLALDYYDRPRQMVDFRNGKNAVTEYRVLRELPGGETDVLFTPLTGRTHQLRVHAAHPLGLGRPIKGDRLYGGVTGAGEHLCLRASSLEFRHPVTSETLHFTTDDFKTCPDECPD